jgi:tight adherence protein C
MISTLIAVSAAVLLVVHLVTRHNRQVADRLGDLSGAKSLDRPASRVLARRAKSNPSSALSKIGHSLLPNGEADQQRLQNRLLQAGIYSSSAASTYSATRLAILLGAPIIGIAVGAFGVCQFRSAVLAGAVLGGVGWTLPNMWLGRMKAGRQLVLRNSLPDFLDLISTCLQSGLSFEAALQRVSDELRTAHPLLAGEMSVVQREIEFGKLPEQALRDFAERSDLDALRTLSTFVEQSRRFGSSMAETLQTHADMLRTQREQWAEERAQKAAVKILFPTLLFIFPPILVVLAGPAAIQLQERFSTSAEESADELEKTK